MVKSNAFPHLALGFLVAMEEIGAYGELKYGPKSFTQNPVRYERTETAAILQHINAHADEYIAGIPHDNFNTRRHQLAAMAFNAMMEYVLADLESEG